MDKFNPALWRLRFLLKTLQGQEITLINTNGLSARPDEHLSACAFATAGRSIKAGQGNGHGKNGASHSSGDY